jgi:ribonuclease VapC
MYLDSSAILAILFREPEADILLDRIEEALTNPITSPITLLEVIPRAATKLKMTLAEAHDLFREDFLNRLSVQIVSITPEIGNKAIRAYATYGKGSGHPAKLNMGDAFSYACAKNYGVPLLYKGDDFSKTDLG